MPQVEEKHTNIKVTVQNWTSERLSKVKMPIDTFCSHAYELPILNLVKSSILYEYYKG